MGGWRAVLVGLAVTVTVTVTACSLIVATDGLVSGGDGGGVTASDGGEAGLPASKDGGTPGDAEGGSDPDADAAPMPFCASLSPRPKYCADFDTGTISDYGSLIGTPTLDSAASKSPPRSLLGIVEVGASEHDSKVQHDFTDTPASFDVAFDILVDEYDPAHDVELVNVYLAQTGSRGCVLGVSVRTNNWDFDESCDDGTTSLVSLAHRSAIALSLAHWTHVVFSVSFGAHSFSLTVDGQPAFAAIPLQDGVTTGTASLFTGINYLQPQAETRAKLHVDNVTFDYP